MAKIFLSFALLGLLLAGCASQPTQVIVTVDAEPGVRASATQLHLVVSGGSGDRFDRVLTPGVGDPDWGFELALAPLDGDASRVWGVTAEAGGVTARAVGGYVEGQTLFVTLLLEDSCRGIICGAEQTCQAGACVDAGGIVVPSGDAGVGSDAGDAGVDLGRDGGDAGVRDGGPVDAGGVCPPFSPGMWHIEYTQGVPSTSCPAAFQRDVSAVDLAGLQVPCSDAGMCTITPRSACVSWREWMVGPTLYRTRLTLVTGSRVTGTANNSDNPSACYFNVEATLL